MSLVADQRFGGDADALTEFFGTFNFALGAVELPAAAAPRRSGAAALRTRRHDPGAAALARLRQPADPAPADVLDRAATNALDQGLRFSLDKATYELLYLPLPPAQRAPIKNTIDIVVSRFADAAGAVLLGIATEGFLIVGALAWACAARRPSTSDSSASGRWSPGGFAGEYVRTIQPSIHRHRIDSEQVADGSLDRSAAGSSPTSWRRRIDGCHATRSISSKGRGWSGSSVICAGC